MVAPIPDGRIARSMVRVPGSGGNDTAGFVCLNLGNVSSFAGIVPVPQNLSFNTRHGRQQVTSTLSLTSTKQNGGFTSPFTSPLNDNDAASEEKEEDSPPESLVDENSSAAASGDAITSVIDSHEEAQSSPPTISLPTAPPPTAALPSPPPPTALPSEASASRQKRPFRQDSAEEPAVVPKRYKSMAAASATTTYAMSSNPQATQGTTAGGLAVPMFFPMAVPIAMAQAGNGTTPSLILPGLMPQNLVQVPTVMMAGQGSLVARPSNVQKMVKERDQLRRENVDLKKRLLRFHQLLRNKEKLISVLRHLEAVPS